MVNAVPGSPASSSKRGGARLWLLAATLPLALSACEQAIQVRGNLPDDGDVAKISPGIHTRGDIASLLGTPSTVSTFEDSKWYYIGQKTTEFAFFEPEVLERKILVVSFDPAGTVAETKVYTLEDGQAIDPVERVTPTEGKDMTILQQLIGNLGRFRGDTSSY